jgi:hypothetical protein
LVQNVRRMDQRQAATLSYEIWTVWETKPSTKPQKTSRQLDWKKLQERRRAMEKTEMKIRWYDKMTIYCGVRAAVYCHL